MITTQTLRVELIEDTAERGQQSGLSPGSRTIRGDYLSIYLLLTFVRTGFGYTGFHGCGKGGDRARVAAAYGLR